MPFDLDTCRSVGDAFAARAAAHPERTALTVFRGSASDAHDELGYGELDRRAGDRAAWLAERLAPGERVLLMLPTGTDFAELYLGCLQAGLVVVPAPEPGGGNAVQRIAAIARDCAPGLAVTTAAGREDLMARFAAQGLGHLPVVQPGDMGTGNQPTEFTGEDGDARDERRDGRRRPGRDDVAVIQYSSGSTGEPKGVVLTHGAILTHTAAMSSTGAVRTEDIFGSWLPLHHDMGLFVMFTAGLLFGTHVVLMPPVEFVKRPVEWFRMLDRFGCTITAGPNFAFDLCVRAIPEEKLTGVDLSGLRRLFDGAEPIRPETVAAFTERFARNGLRPETVAPCYGLAEATAYVSVSRNGERPTVLRVDPAALESPEDPRLLPAADGRALMGVGRLGDLEARIVEPHTGRVLPDGAVGEIWLRGAHFGTGYWNRPELSALIFNAELAEDGDTARDGNAGENGTALEDESHHTTGGERGGWLRTGDLGAFRDGELFVTGRLKEMLILHGRNIFPQDVEHEARSAHRALAGFVGAAFAVEAPEQRVVLVHEIDPATPREELPVVAKTVARHLTTALGVPLRNVVLVRRGTVRRTTSGKIQRAAMRERFLAGDVPALHLELEPAVRGVSAGVAGVSDDTGTSHDAGAFLAAGASASVAAGRIQG